MSEGKIVTFEELQQHKTKDHLYLLLHQKGLSFLSLSNLHWLTQKPIGGHVCFTVYDVQKFIDEVGLRNLLLPLLQLMVLNWISTPVVMKLC